MKICFLADGRSIHTKKWVEYFAQFHEVHLITMQYPSGLLDIKRCEVHYIPRNTHKILINGRLVRQLVEKIQPDLLHAHFATHYGYWGACTHFHPFVVSCWGDDILIHPKKPWLRYFVKKAINSADLVTADGVNSIRAAVAIINDPKKLKLVRHGVDINRFKYHYDETSKTVIYMRGFEPVYDWKTFTDAIPLVIKRVPDVKFLVLGAGSQTREALMEIYKYPDHVSYIGLAPIEAVIIYLGMSDVYVSTSISEGGMALSMLEAMACGVIPVVTDVGDNDSIIKDGNGVVCCMMDPKCIADGVVRLLEDPLLRKYMSTINRQYIECEQNYYKWMSDMNHVYVKLVNK